MAVALQMFVAIGIPAAVIVLIMYFRHLERLRVLQVVDAAAERKDPLSPELVRSLPGARQPVANLDLRRGVLLIAIGVAIIIIGLCVLIGVATTGGEGAVAAGVGVAAVGFVPLSIGIALVVLSRADRLLA